MVSRASLSACAAALAANVSLPGAAWAEGTALTEMATAVIENLDERLASRMTSILQALATSSSSFGGSGSSAFADPNAASFDARFEAFDALGVSHYTAPGQAGAAAATARAALDSGRLFDVWAKPYGGYWNRPTSGDIDGSEGHSIGLAVGAGRILSSEWNVGLLGGIDYNTVDYDSTGETVQTTAAFGGFSARFQGQDGHFGGLGVIGGYAWNTATQPVALYDIDEKADYGATFAGVVGSVGKRYPLSDMRALRLTATGSYVGEWTQAYSFSHTLYDATIDAAFVDALNGRLEVAVEQRHNLGLGGLFELSAGVLGHTQPAGEQDVEVQTIGVFQIIDPSENSVAGFVGAGVDTRMALNWFASAKGQVYYSSDHTIAVAGYLRLLGIF